MVYRGDIVQLFKSYGQPYILFSKVGQRSRSMSHTLQLCLIHCTISYFQKWVKGQIFGVYVKYFPKVLTYEIPSL